MMTNEEILREKVVLFTKLENALKLREEIREADIANDAYIEALIHGATPEEMRDIVFRLAEELADVDTSGISTLQYSEPAAHNIFENKKCHSIRVQIKGVIDARRDSDNLIAGDGD